MLEFVPSLLKPKLFLEWRFLCTLDEAVHASEMDVLVAHVARLECELKQRNPECTRPRAPPIARPFAIFCPSSLETSHFAQMIGPRLLTQSAVGCSKWLSSADPRPLANSK